MPPATLPKSNTPISALSSVATNNTTMAVQSGPYTKTQFQSTMEGSRTIKSSKEVEQLLRDYPAALELYRTGKYKVKVKCEADVERVILVEKRTPKVTSNNSTTATNETQENNQTVPDVSSNSEHNKESRGNRSPRRSRSRTHSQDRVAPTTTISATGNIVHTTISSIRMTSNTQPKVDHQPGHSKERDVSVTPQQKQSAPHRSQSRDSQQKGSYNKQQGSKTTREYPKMMVPFGANGNNSGNLWQQQQQQQRPVPPYFSNPLLQQQRSGVFMAPPFMQQPNLLYRQPYYYGQQQPGHVMYPSKQSAYSAVPVPTAGKARLRSTTDYSPSSRSASNAIALPPSFRTFQPNQPPSSSGHHRSARPMNQSQVPFPFNPSWTNMANQPVGALTNNNNIYVDPRKGSRDRARSVDVSSHKNPPSNVRNIQQQQQQQQQAIAMIEHKHHYHHHRHRTHPTHNTGPPVVNNKEQSLVPAEPPSMGIGEKLTVRQLNDIFAHTDSSGRLPYNSIPAVLQRFGISLTEHDITSAARDLGYNLNDSISARRLVHILVKLGKITKSNQQQQQQQQQQQPQQPHQPVSPSMLPEDREVTDIMTQRQAINAQTNPSIQPIQWH